MFLDSVSPLIIILALLGIFGVLALVVFLLRKFLPSLRGDEEKPVSKEEAAKENLDRILVPIEEEKVPEEDVEKQESDEESK